MTEPVPSTKGRKTAPKVYALSKPSRCYSCDTKLDAGSIVKIKRADDESEVQCQNCAGLTNFEQLPSGNAKWTRLVPKYSPDYYVIVRWSELWKCYERQGMLVQKEALAKLKAEMLEV